MSLQSLFKKITGNMININGKQYSGNSITIRNGQVIIDGKNVSSDDKVINISIDGNVNSVDVDYCSSLSVKGDVKTVTTSSGDVKVDGNAGSIKTSSGDVDVSGNVSGDVSTVSGDVECGHVTGKVSTISGDIANKK